MLTALLVVPFILSSVSASQYGLWLVLSSSATLLYYSDFGIGTAIVHFSSRIRGGGGRYTPSDLLSAGLIWNTAASLVIVPIYIWLARGYLLQHAGPAGLDANSRGALLAFGAVTTSGLVLRPIGAALVGAGFQPIEQRNQGVAAVFRLVATLVVCWLTSSVALIAMVETMALLLPSVLSAITLLRLDPHRIRMNRSAFGAVRYMLSYSTKAFLSSLIDAGLLQGGTIAAGILATPADAAYFNIAFRIFSSVRQLLYWITEPLRPALSRLYATSKVEADIVLQAMSRVMLFGATLGCIALIFGGPGLIRIWLGDKVPVDLVAATSAILLAGLILNSIHLPFALAAYSAGRPAAFLVPQIIWFLTFVGLVVPSSSSWGIPGIAFAFAAPLLFVEPIYLFIASRTLGVSFRRWLMTDAMPAVYVAVSGAIASIGLSAIIGVTSTVAHAFWATLFFVVGLTVAVLLRPRTIPTESIRTIFRTEL
jgi:O-antigen/teichoic acid export membrane protein